MVQEISEKTDLPHDVQTIHHIHSQCDESVSANTEDYSLAGYNEDFEVPEESSEESSLFRS